MGDERIVSIDGGTCWSGLGYSVQLGELHIRFGKCIGFAPSVPRMSCANVMHYNSLRLQAMASEYTGTSRMH